MTNFFDYWSRKVIHHICRHYSRLTNNRKRYRKCLRSYRGKLLGRLQDQAINYLPFPSLTFRCPARQFQNHLRSSMVKPTPPSHHLLFQGYGDQLQLSVEGTRTYHLFGSLERKCIGFSQVRLECAQPSGLHWVQSARGHSQNIASYPKGRYLRTASVDRRLWSEGWHCHCVEWQMRSPNRKPGRTLWRTPSRTIRGLGPQYAQIGTN